MPGEEAIGYQMHAGVCGAVDVLVLGSLYTLCVITATAAGNKVSKHLEAA